MSSKTTINEPRSVKDKKEANTAFSTDIGTKIQKLMESHQLSLGKVASATGLSTESIRQIVNGTTRNPGIETLTKIADAFSMSLFELLETKDASFNVSNIKIKIVDFLDLQKINSGNNIENILSQSTESVEILLVNDDTANINLFAIVVDNTIAEKLATCGMPMLNTKDLLIFTKNNEHVSNSLILFKSHENTASLGIVIEVEPNFTWVKSVDIPFKQIVSKIDKNNIIGVLHNVQFNKNKCL